jgi:putative hydrolase of the HAD superfamily
MSRPLTPEVVFLDAGDTLLRADPSWAAVYLSAFPEYGVQVTEEQLAKALTEAVGAGAWDMEGPFEATEEASFERIVAFDRAVLASLGHTDLPDAFFHAIETSFRQQAAWHVFPDVVPALERLEEAGFRLAIISNWLWEAPELFHDLEVARHFEHMIISARVGYQKPHRAIFEHALEVMGVPADAAIHVGDSYRADVLGARAAGIEPVLIDRAIGDPARLSARPPDDDVAVIGDLFGLLDLLGVERPLARRAS